MNKKQIMLSIVAMIMLTNVSLAQEAEEPKLGVTLSVKPMSKHIWRGYDVLGDHGALYSNMNVNLFDTGFSVNLWNMTPIGSGTDNYGRGNNSHQECDYTVAYGFALFKEEPYALNIAGNFTHYDFPKLNKYADAQEIGISVALPKLISIGDTALIPSYYVGKLWPATSGESGVIAGGYHCFALNWNMEVPCPFSKDTKQVFSFFTDINYNDGIFGSDHDWSHATLGVSTNIALGPVTVTPCLQYQISMDKSVNDEEELWCGLNVSYSF